MYDLLIQNGLVIDGTGKPAFPADVAVSGDRIAKIAYEKGLRHSDLTGNLKKWVDSLYFRNRSANQIRLYSDKAYIFTGDKLITVIQIPHNLVKEVDKLRRSKQQYDAEVKFEKNEKGTL